MSAQGPVHRDRLPRRPGPLLRDHPRSATDHRHSTERSDVIKCAALPSDALSRSPAGRWSRTRPPTRLPAASRSQSALDMADSADVVIAKRLLDYAKQSGFTFQRIAPEEDAALVGYRVSDCWTDLIHIEGFSRDCFAWRKRTSSLIVSHEALIEHQVEGSALDVLNEVLTWEPATSSSASPITGTPRHGR